MLGVPQTLTAIHDKTSAWLGPGSSLVSLFHQWTLSTDLWGVLQVALYLMLISLVHITIPSTFLVAAGTRNTTLTWPTQLGHQFLWNLTSNDL